MAKWASLSAQTQGTALGAKSMEICVVTKPLSFLKVLDMTTVIMGPTTNRILGDYGATVIKLESEVRPDSLRSSTPYKSADKQTLNNSGFFAAYNASKLSLALNLRKSAGREFFRRYLVPWADVIVEAYSTGTMEEWELDYPRLRAINPKLIMMRICLLGHTGRHADLKGFGQLTSALGGFYELIGWPDREPAGPYSAYTDFVSWPFALVGLLSAVDHRRRTGQGQYIDLSLLETTLQFVSHGLLDYQANGRLATRQGNRDPYAAPHGVYRCRHRAEYDRTEERWVAIAVSTDSQWRALCQAIGRPALVSDPRFATLRARLTHQDELDAVLQEWTLPRTPEEVETLLQEQGVPAGSVHNARDLFEDPQLKHRGIFATVPHPEMGPHAVLTSSFKLSETPGLPERGAPVLGEHLQYICSELLGVPNHELSEWTAAQIFE